MEIPVDIPRQAALFGSPRSVLGIHGRLMKFLLYISPALFVLSCCMPCLEIKESSGKTDIMLGLRALAVGWSGIFAGITAWYANPVWLLCVALGFYEKPLPGIFGGAMAVAIGWTTRSVIGRVLPADEGNVNKMTVVRVLPGFYVWIASLCALTVVSLMQRFSR